ncbi:MAG: hypothetical protein HQK66_14795, partial [Desulfamplus sp.]|nr:hypothetical protein [Desulfamplus sp.]
MDRFNFFTFQRKTRLCIFLILPLIFMMTVAVNLSRGDESGGYRYDGSFPKLQQPWHFWHPTSVATTLSGNILVADSENHRIVKLNPDGQLITTWGRYGDGDGEFNLPSSVAVDLDGNVYVLGASMGKARIQKFDSHGIFILEWGQSGDGNGEFSFVSSRSHVAISPGNIVYITDTANNRIQKFTSNGNFISTIDTVATSSGTDMGLIYPSGIAFDRDGTLFVVHQHQESTLMVTRLSGDDKYISSFILDTMEDVTMDNGDPLMDVAGIAMGGDGNLYIADMTGHRILIYSPDGTFVNAFGSQGSGPSQFNNPSAISFGSDGKIFVADRGNNRIEKLSEGGRHINSWQSGGTAPGMFRGASAITLDQEGNLFLADTGNHRIKKLAPGGTFLMGFGEQGSEQGQFNRPVDVDVDSQGNIYVADKLNFRIQKFDPRGNFLKEWGARGLQDGDFGAPVSVAVDPAGNVYVGDLGGFRVQKFTSQGDFILKWGRACNRGDYGPGCFGQIEDIAVDALGNVYVTDHHLEHSDKFELGRVQKFTPEGGIISVTGIHGTDSGSLDYPLGLDIDGQGNIFVADSRNYRVQKFDSQGIPVGVFGEFGSGPGQFLAPKDVAVDPGGGVFVLDAFTNSVQYFKPGDQDGGSAPINRKAIIVAGGGPYPGNTLWNTTKSCANFAHRTLRHLGYAKDDIYYLCDDDGLDLDGNGIFDDIYGKPGPDIIEKLITTTLADADELLLYFVDHGGDQTFSLDGSADLTAQSLDQWLDTYESQSSGHSTLIYDACRSGSFIPAMTPHANGTRTVITSAQGDEYAYFVSFGIISFSEYFWTALFNGHDVTTAFGLARSAMTLLDLSQNPMIDADGNGIANEDSDYALSLARENGISLDRQRGKNNAAQGPVIGHAEPLTIVDQSGGAFIRACEVSSGPGEVSSSQGEVPS